MLAGGAAIIFSLIIIAVNIRLDSQGKKNSENVLNILESEISSYSEDENNITYTDGNGLKKSKTISALHPTSPIFRLRRVKRRWRAATL